jgi:hypothetical protein
LSVCLFVCLLFCLSVCLFVYTRTISSIFLLQVVGMYVAKRVLGNLPNQHLPTLSLEHLNLFTIKPSAKLLIYETNNLSI